MRGYLAFGIIAVLILGLGLGAAGTTAGISVGVDPTGIYMFSAIVELPIGSSLDIRAEGGIATGDLAGLMVGSLTLLYHRTFPPFDPFVGIGFGGALTPPPFTTGLVLEGAAGVRIAPVEPLVVFVQVRYLVRFTPEGWMSGPVYEGGLGIGF